MIPETVVAMLACARIGAPHSVVFGGFSAEALHTRIDDAEAKVVITSDGGYRRGAPSALKPAVDDAAVTAEDSPVEKVLVVQAHRPGRRLGRRPRRLVARGPRGRRPTPTRPQPFDSEHPLFILYTSRHHGEAQGHLPHHAAATSTQAAYTNAVVHDVHPETDVYWCTADVGWVTGHSLHRLRAARQRRDPGDVRGHARHPAPGPLVGDHREVQGLDPLHRTDRDPHLHEVGRRHPGQVRPVLAAAARRRSASRSTPRPGSGTASTSAAAAPRSSTPGGRPRPARIMISPLPGVTDARARARRRGRSPASAPRSSTTRASRSPRPRRSATSC